MIVFSRSFLNSISDWTESEPDDSQLFVHYVFASVQSVSYIEGREACTYLSLNRAVIVAFSLVFSRSILDSNMSSYEEVPMKNSEDGEGAKKESGQAFVISRKQAIVLVVIVIVLIIFVGVISGVFSARQARKDALVENEKKRRDDSGTTEKPSVEKPTEPTRPEPWYKIRLPQNILPIHYDFYLDPHLEQNTFEGNVSILIKVTEKSDYMSYILIHINDMNVTHAKVYKPASNAKSNSATLGEEVALKDTFEYPENDYFVFQLEDDLEVGQYVLVMAYKSTFSSQLNGLYISTYTNEKGEKR